MPVQTSISHAAGWFAAVVLVVVGLVGTVLPGLPGILLLYAGMLLGAWMDGFHRVGWPTLVLLGVLTVIALLADTLAGVLGARRFGASRQALIGSVLGGLIGPLAGFGLPGLLLGPFVGAVVGELLARRPVVTAARVGLGTWLGLIAGTLAKIAIAVSMLGIFVGAWLI